MFEVMGEFYLSVKEIAAAFMVLFAVIDITGSVPVIINLNASGKRVKSAAAAVISFAVIILFLFAGEAMLKLFNG